MSSSTPRKSCMAISWALARRFIFVPSITCFCFYRYHILYNFNENKNVDLKLSFVSSNNSVSEVEYLLYILRCFPFSFELYFFLMRSSHSNDHFPMCNVIIVYSQDVLFLLGFQQFYSKFCVYDFLYIHQHRVCWASWVCNFHQVLEIFN